MNETKIFIFTLSQKKFSGTRGKITTPDPGRDPGPQGHGQSDALHPSVGRSQEKGHPVAGRPWVLNDGVSQKAYPSGLFKIRIPP